MYESQEEQDYYEGHPPEPEPDTCPCFKCRKEMYQISEKPEENLCMECVKLKLLS